MNTFHLKSQRCQAYLKWVDVQSSHWSYVLVTFSNDHVTLSGHDLRWIVEDDVAVLASSNEDARWVAACVHSIRTPDQFVVSVGGACTMNRCTQGKESTRGACSAVLGTCERRRSCRMTSCPVMGRSSPAQKIPGMHWC